MESTTDQNGLAAIKKLSGRIRMKTGDVHGALGDFEEAAAIYREYEYELNEVLTLLLVADAAGSLGRREAVEAALIRAAEAASLMDDGAALADEVDTALRRWEL